MGHPLHTILIPWLIGNNGFQMGSLHLFKNLWIPILSYTKVMLIWAACITNIWQMEIFLLFYRVWEVILTAAVVRYCYFGCTIYNFGFWEYSHLFSKLTMHFIAFNKLLIFFTHFFWLDRVHLDIFIQIPRLIFIIHQKKKSKFHPLFWRHGTQRLPATD